MPFLVLLAFQA
jgi:hypothetical protein